VTAKPPSYLRGEYRGGGWWYFYLYGWAVKLPLGIWAIIYLACATQLSDWRGGRSHANSSAVRYLLAVGSAFFLFVTMKSGVQFLRYTLPALPFILIWASQVAAECRTRPLWFRSIIVGGVVWGIGSSISVFPHSLSYYNELAGGPRTGYLHLIDDSYDWGQDLLYLKKWYDAHPEARPLHLAYWGGTDPRFAGIEFELPPLKSVLTAVNEEDADTKSVELKQYFEPIQLKPGWYAVSVGHSHGGPWARVHDGSGREVIISHGDFDYFRNINSTESAGYSIRIFYLDEDAAKKIVETLRQPRKRIGNNL
jgi:hypothetical protein